MVSISRCNRHTLKPQQVKNCKEIGIANYSPLGWWGRDSAPTSGPSGTQFFWVGAGAAFLRGARVPSVGTQRGRRQGGFYGKQGTSLCLHFLVQNSVTWPPLLVREPRKCRQSWTHRENKNRHVTEPLPRDERRSGLSDVQSCLFLDTFSLNIVP